MMSKNILDEFWINWDEKSWNDKSQTLKKVAHRLMEEIPSRNDLDNLRGKMQNLRDTEEDKALITPSRELIEKWHQELIQKYGENFSPWAEIERPSKEARECRSQYEKGEITLEEFIEKLKYLPRGTVPVITDHLWVDWEKKSLEEQVHLVMISTGIHPKGVISIIDLWNECAHRDYVEEKLGFELPKAY